MFEKIVIKLSGINCSKINPIDYGRLQRFPAHSLDEKIKDISYKYIGLLVYASIVMVSLMLLVSPWFLLLHFVIMVGLSVKFFNDISTWRLGRDGEKAMAQYLNSIARELNDMYIYHDIWNERDGFNIDHVVVSKKGIFIIDTKTYSKERGIERNTIRVDGNSLLKNDIKIKKNLVSMVEKQAAWLEKQLSKKLDIQYEIKSTLAFIGWHIDGPKINNTYIANAKNITSILENKYLKKEFSDKELNSINRALRDMATQEDRSKSICS